MNTTTRTGQLIRIDAIDTPAEYQRKSSLVEDDALRQSIEQSGVQQPAVVFAKPDGRYALIDGGRRLQIAQALGLHTIPAVIDELPEDVEPAAYQNRLRFVLDEHRQDLFPTQRAALITKMKQMFGMNNRDVAAYLGVDPSSLTGWLAIEHYIPEVRKAIDTGEVTLHASRALDGVSVLGQGRIFRSHRKDMRSLAGGKFHKLVRAKYPPRKFPEFYSNPEKTEEKLARRAKGRKSKRRPRLTRDEKAMLAADLDLKATELEEGKAELLQLKKEITLATQPIRGILRSKALKELIPAETLEELERFAEVYV